MLESQRIGRRQAVITLSVAAAIIGLVVVGLWLSDPSRRLERAVRTEETVKQYRTPSAGVDPSDVWITRSEAELRALKQDDKDLKRQVAELKQALQELHERERNAPVQAITRSEPPAPEPPPPSPIPTPPQPEITTPGATAAKRLLPAPPVPPRTRRSGARPGTLPSGILAVNLESGPNGKETQRSGKGAGKSVKHNIRHYLPAGAFARAVLLSGLDAPTGELANTNPHPVLIRLADHGRLPNRFRSRVKECFVTAAGYGDLSSERAYLRLERLSCVLHDGEVVEVAIKGFVSGEDGKAGMRGRLVTKQSQMIAKALLAGIAGGLGKGLTQSMTSTSTSALGSVQTVDPDKLFKYGMSQGASSALDKVADWYLQRANETYPIIEVDAGRTEGRVENRFTVP